MSSSVSSWLADASALAVGGLVLLTLIAAASLGSAIRKWLSVGSAPGGGEAVTAPHDYLVSALLGLLALLLAFTFSVALDYYERRRMLVIEEANAIGTAYLRTQLLEEPYRTVISKVLIDYTDNRLELGSQRRIESRSLALNDRLLQDLWIQVVASAGSDRSRALIVPITQSFNQLIDLDLERKMARQARVPPEVFLALYIYLIATGCVLGYVLHARGGKAIALVLFVLVTLTVMLVIDLNNPTAGRIRETQQPMILLRQTLHAGPPATFGKPGIGSSPETRVP